MALYVIGDLHLSEKVSKPMDVFGGAWQDYTQKIIKNWYDTVKDTDTVVIAGDISWGISLDEALYDFKLIDSFPGKKILLKGNHDYWWETVTKMKKYFDKNGITTIDFLYNNSFEIDNKSVCGTRGWSPEEGDTDRKMIAREAGRLDRSLSCAKDGTEKIAVFHYPPIYDGGVIEPFIDVMQKHGVKRCFFGHLHGPSIARAVTGENFGINFQLVSADSLDFLPLYI